MRIGILSDTHIPQQVACLPHQIAEAFAGVELILHAGDICNPSVLDELERIAPVLAALGDDDCFTVYDARVKANHQLTVAGLSLWLTHALRRSSPYDQSKSLSDLDAYHSAADILVFGHSHIPRIDYYQNLLLVNPGSPTLPNYAPRLGTVAILNIVDGKAVATIQQLQ